MAAPHDPHGAGRAPENPPATAGATRRRIFRWFGLPGLLVLALGSFAVVDPDHPFVQATLDPVLDAVFPGGGAAADRALARAETAVDESRYEAARDAADHALARYRERDDTPGALRALLTRGDAQRLLAEPAAAERSYAEARREAGLADLPRIEARAVTGLAGLAYASDRRREARTLYGEALGLCERAGDGLCVAVARTGLGLVDYVSGDNNAAFANFGAADRYYASRPTLDDRDERRALRGEAANSCALARLQTATGDDQAARRELARAMELYDELGSTHGEARTLRLRGELELEQRDFAAARDVFDKSIDRYASTPDRRGEASAELGLARAQIGLGALDTAAESARRAESLYVDRSLPGQGDALLVLGRIELERGDRSAAAAAFHQARGLYRNGEHAAGEGDALVAIARLEHADGRDDEALQHLADATHLYRRADASNRELDALAREIIAGRAGGARRTPAVSAPPPDFDAGR